MSEEYSTRYLQTALGLARQMMAEPVTSEGLCLAVGVLIGGKHDLRTEEQWAAWGELVSKLLLVLARRLPATPAAAAPPAAPAQVNAPPPRHPGGHQGGHTDGP